MLLIAPSAIHLLEHGFHDPGDLQALVLLANRLAIAGLGCLVVAMTAALFLIATVLYQTVVAAAVAAILALFSSGVWFGVPVIRYIRRHRSGGA